MASQSQYDLVVRNAVIVDGTGGPPAEGDVAVRDGLIAAVGGHCGGSGAEEVDGRDLVLAPGFIDPHTHLDANLFWDADLTPSSSFGVTTVVTSNCGYGLAPVLADDAKAYVVAALSTVEQIPERSITAAVPFDWDDLASYCARLDQLDVLINHAFQVGHVPLRAAVLGVPDAHLRQAFPDEIAAMGRVLRQGLELGALGFSTDQVVGNPGPGGTELPGQVCGDDELLALAAVLGQGPGPGLFTMANAALLQGRPERVADLSWHRRLAETSGRPVVVGPIFGSHEDPGGAVAIMDLVVEGQRPAATVVPQISTRPFELWTRLDSPGLLVRSLPHVAGRRPVRRCRGVGGWPAIARAGSNSVEKGRPWRLRRSSRGGGSTSGYGTHTSPTWKEGTWHPSRPSGDAAPTDLLLDLALTDNFDTQVATVMRNGDDDEVASLVAHPAAMIGASDAGAHMLANTDSCYAVWTLQHWVRERKALTLERAIAKLTGDQARLLGLGDRGLVRTGLAADLVLFDPDAIRTTGVRFVDDQPEGGRRLVTDATGLEMSMVNGVVATRQGTSTGARSGRRLRPVA